MDLSASTTSELERWTWNKNPSNIAWFIFKASALLKNLFLLKEIQYVNSHCTASNSIMYAYRTFLTDYICHCCGLKPKNFKYIIINFSEIPMYYMQLLKLGQAIMWYCNNQ